MAKKLAFPTEMSYNNSDEVLDSVGFEKSIQV